MADIEPGAEATTPEAPAQETTPSGEQTTDVYDLGVAETLDEIAGLRQEETDDQEETSGAEAFSESPDTAPGGPTGLHESLKNLQEIRSQDPEHQRAWNEHLKGLDKIVRQHEAERAAFTDEQQKSAAMLEGFTRADTPEKATQALAELAEALERRHGYSLGLKGDPVDGKGFEVPKRYANDDDQKAFEDDVRATAEIVTGALRSEIAELKAELQRRTAPIEEIAVQRQQEKERAATVAKIKSDIPLAAEKVAQWSSGWKPTDAQWEEAGLKYPHLPLEDAVFLAHKDEAMAHRAKVGAPRKTQTTVPQGAGAKASPPADPYDLGVESILDSIVAQRR